MICSQNLKRYGIEKLASDRTKELAGSFVSAGCEILAVQELRADTTEQAELLLQQLASELLLQSGRAYEFFTGKSNDRFLKLGFLVARDRLLQAKLYSYADTLLPKFLLHQPQRLFVRGPLELELEISTREAKKARRLTLVNFHFKSKHNFPRDPAGLSWETYRMEAAAGLRRIVLERQAKNIGENINPVVLLGDRNSEQESASAEILAGSLELSDFRSGGQCKVSKDGMPHCARPVDHNAQFFSVLAYNPFLAASPGTFKRGREELWIDDILLPSHFFASGLEHHSSRRIVSGIYPVSDGASDHNLLYAFLDW